MRSGPRELHILINQDSRASILGAPLAHFSAPQSRENQLAVLSFLLTARAVRLP
jgi:hypothetical protein